VQGSAEGLAPGGDESNALQISTFQGLCRAASRKKRRSEGAAAAATAATAAAAWESKAEG